MRWRLLAAFLGVMVVMLVAQDLPLVSHLRRVEVDRQLAELERDAFILAGQAASALSPPDGWRSRPPSPTPRSPSPTP